MIKSRIHEESIAAIPDVFQRHAALKCLLSESAEFVKQELSLRPPDTLAEKVHWSVKFCRAVRSRDLHSASLALRAYPSLEEFVARRSASVVITRSLFSQVRVFAASLAEQLAAEDGKNIDADRSTAASAKIYAKQKVDFRIQLWRKAHRRVTFAGVKCLDSAGVDFIAGSPEESAEALRAHWAPVFKHKAVDVASQDVLLQFVPTVDGSAATIPSIDDLVKFLGKRSDSAPGPDGLRYSAWRAAGPVAVESLHSVFSAVLAGDAMPDDTRLSSIVMIPKAMDDALLAYPGDLRPISLTNCDAKVWACMLNWMLAPLVEDLVTPVQKGFMRHRFGGEHIIEADFYGLDFARRFSQPAYIFLDMQAAFPSVAHSYVLRVLRKRLGDCPLFRAIADLYSDLSASIAVAGTHSAEFPVGAGVRQGCPLSGTIFAVAFHPWLLWMQAQMNMEACMKFNREFAYADDLLILLQDLWGGLLKLYSFCTLLYLAAGLALNIKKTCIVPLWPRSDLAASKRRLTAMIPAWKDVVWDLAYKYLGVFIGPAAHLRRWLDIDRSLIAVASEIASASSSWQHAGFLYSTYCISRLSYRLQFIPFDATLKKLEARLVAKITSTPMHVINATVRQYLVHATGKRTLPDLAQISEATLIRVWCKYDHAETLFARLENQDLDDDLLYIPPFPEWHRSAIIRVLGETYRRREAQVNSIRLGGRGLQGCILRAISSGDYVPQAISERIAFSLRKLRFNQNMAAHATNNLSVALSKLPLSVVSAYLKALVNGWTTSHRMGVVVGSCPFCQSESHDSLAHGLACALALGLVHRLLPKLALPPHDDPFVVMLGGIAMPQLTTLGLAVALDCIHTAMMAGRFGGNAGDGAQVAEARLRTLCLNHPRARAVVLALR
jgi:hypothetical protein